MMNSDPRYEGIIVLGAPRSGTTLLRRLLDSHPNIACPGETNILNACARFLHSEVITEGVDMGVLGGLSFAGFPDQAVLGRLRAFAFAFPREYAARQGKRRWAEKTAVDSFYVDRIERLCGEHAHFICVVRHGLDVACSYQDLVVENGAYLGELHAYIKLYRRPLEAFCHAWAEVTTAIRTFAERHPQNALLFRYEDLIDNPEAVLRRIIEFVGEPWDPTLLDRAMRDWQGTGLGDWKTYRKAKIDGSSVGRWHNLSRATISSLGPLVNPTLVANGYEPVEVEPTRSLAEARRRYELGLLAAAARHGN
jgi:hypothetical protein